jgi:asparagine synthase (glutamine-hydrolysing)
MCGIAGLFDATASATAEDLVDVVSRMTDTLRHRGPDGGDVWVDAQAGMALGHRRLAIIDVSPLGHQPMSSRSGRFVVTFNGEIYNFRELRRDLEKVGEPFRGHSDTEVLLAAVERWGIEQAVIRAAGMFAFALWDRAERTLHLVRDRLGKKPLYFGWSGHRLLFASELKAFRAMPSFAAVVDRAALALFLRHSCVPAPYSIYRDVFKLPAGASLALNAASKDRGRDALKKVQRYWSAMETAVRGGDTPLDLTSGEEQAVDQLETLLGIAVSERMIADVPLGALLSGGIDSSTVVALMQKHSTAKVRTFSIGFHERGFDEAMDAARVARHLGTEHSELYVTPDEVRAVIPRVPDLYDEPFGDQSQIPTFLVSQFARRHVTVALSGDGGDEVFGGYQRHYQAERLARLVRLPLAVRAAAARSMIAVSPDRWDGLFLALTGVLPGLARAASGDKVHKFADILRAEGPQAAYLVMASHWRDPPVIEPDDEADSSVLAADLRLPELGDYALAMMALDTATYLPDDVLTKVDRASMAVGLEARAPLLDHRVVEFAWRLPRHLKIRGGKGKWILRKVLARHVPPALFERPKQGFGMPVGEWLRGSLRPWAEELLDESRLSREGFLQPEPIRAKWSEHLSGRRNWAYHLWDVLMFQAWKQRWLP